MRQISFKMDENIVINLQRASWKWTAALLIERMIKNQENDPGFLKSPVFKAYQSEYTDAYMEFEMLKDSISKTVIPEYLRAHDLKWSIDYSACTITIDVMCDCEIPELEEK